MELLKPYHKMTDMELVDLVMADDGEALDYLIYQRYENDLRFCVWKIYGSFDYYDDLCSELCGHLKGKNGDWSVLRTFQWRCSFRTWFCKVSKSLFLDKRNKLIGLPPNDASIRVVSYGDRPLPEPECDSENQQMVMFLEALTRLNNEEYRLILQKELEGYNHAEIAEIIAAKRKKEGRESYYNGHLVVPDARSVDRDKHRALKRVKEIIEQIKKEWYEC